MRWQMTQRQTRSCRGARTRTASLCGTHLSLLVFSYLPISSTTTSRASSDNLIPMSVSLSAFDFDSLFCYLLNLGVSYILMLFTCFVSVTKLLFFNVWLVRALLSTILHLCFLVLKNIQQVMLGEDEKPLGYVSLFCRI